MASEEYNQGSTRRHEKRTKMSLCVNEDCRKEIDLDHCVIATADGDLACSEKCRQAYIQQREYFMTHILPNDKLFSAWLGVPEEMM